MGRKVFQDFANTLPQMLVGWRMAEDLEVLAALPDGTLVIDALKGSAGHSIAGEISLHITAELQAWLEDRMVRFKIKADELDRAVVQARISTSRIATDRKRIVSFDFDCEALLQSGERRYRGALIERHVWHKRLPNKPMQPTRACGPRG